MTRTDWIRPNSLIYLDANVIIYFIECHDELQAKVTDVLRAATAANCRFATNEAGLAECFYGAFKMNSAPLQAAYSAFFGEAALIELTPVDGPLLLRASKLGAGAGLKLLDASHVVSATEAGAAHLLTNDGTMTRGAGVEVVQLGDL